MRAGRYFAAASAKRLATSKQCRDQDDRGDSVGNSEVAPFNPVTSSESIGDRKGGAPEGRAERNDDHGNQNKNDRVAQRNPLQGRLDEEANSGRGQHVLHSIEGLAVQSVKHRPVRLLGGDEMRQDGGESVGPPVPRGHQQQNNDKNSVRRKKERDFAIGKA